ncbi:MAG: 4Fe-4S dicluster domain-containing protein [Syntrophaceae bacterium]|nr:4Fe-4S dicluster domain-containing protein [Syntrophaceae bacterium]
MLRVNPAFLEEMNLTENFNASACINCGTCTALCPMEINLLPRHLFRFVLMGVKEKIVENENNIYSCLLCKMCEDNCPGGVNITANVRALRNYFSREIYRLSER